ncbi:protein MANNAN SYNTHESIS-RELATED [Populus alba x Populus x berolinensis]|uniref:Protein MANNAN SYNTHESIS-RELATED n=1 Tax=Populus alba x Populus x berolinensis TaxID=444605 RepID=A0AAD6Q9D1_9ROSI|nr:protein MANNAN SYNTHESIS-RELATED [Populus alba x Populus x berolinensis]
MGVDLRQVVAGVLTLTMFVMLGNMIKRDHFDSVEGKFPGARDVEFDSEKVSEQGLVTFSKKNDVESKGFVTFSLTNGPEYHVSQIADAVVVARYIGATLVLPDIRGNKPGDESPTLLTEMASFFKMLLLSVGSFEEIYDVEKFVKSLVGVVKVVKGLPEDVSIRDFAVVKVPNRVQRITLLSKSNQSLEQIAT